MKKSKLMKKSLTLLLAILMIVSVIPIGASAAVDPRIVQFSTGTAADSSERFATISADTITVMAHPATNFKAVMLNYVTLNATGEVYLGNETTPVTSGSAYDLSKYVAKDANGVEVATLDLTVRDSFDADAKRVYKLVIQTKEVSDAYGIKNFYVKDQIASSFAPGLQSFEVIMPLGYDLSELRKQSNVTIELEDKGADHNLYDVGAARGQLYNTFDALGNDDEGAKDWDFKVTSQDGSTQVYNVTVRRARGIETFTVEDQIGASDITHSQFNYAAGGGITTKANGTITVTYPMYHDVFQVAGAKLEAKVAFTSENGDTKVVLRTGAGDTVLTSGVSKVDLTDATTAAGATIEVYYPASSQKYTETYDLIIQEENGGVSSSASSIKSFTAIDASRPGIRAVGTVDGDVLKVTLPKSVNLKNINLEIVAARAASSVTAGSSAAVTPGTANGMWETFEILGLNATGSIAVQVVSEDGTRTKTYALEITQSEVPQDVPLAKFTSFVIKNNTTGVEYAATGLDGVTMTFKVPASTTIGDITAMNMYYANPAGTALYYKDAANNWVPLPASSSKLSGLVGPSLVLPNPATVNGETAIKVISYDAGGMEAGHTEYIVKFVKEDWKTGNQLKDGNVKVTEVYATNEDLTDDHIYSSKIVKDKNGKNNSVSLVKVDVPMYNWQDGNSLDFGMQPVPRDNFVITGLSLPEGAVLYAEVIDPLTKGLMNDNLTRVYTYEDYLADNTVVPTLFPVDACDFVGGGMRLFVLSEKAYYDLDKSVAGGGTIANFFPGGHVFEDDPDWTVPAILNNKGNISEYYFFLKEASERRTLKINGVSIIDEDGYEVEATINGSIINIDVPYSWAKAESDPTGLRSGAAPSNAAGAFYGPEGHRFYLKYDAAPGNFFYGTATNGAVGMQRYRSVGIYYDKSGNPETVQNGNRAFYATADGDLYSFTYGTKAPIEHDYAKLSKLTLSTEFGTTEKDYVVKLNVQPIQDKALMESFSLSAGGKTFDAVIKDTTITVSLPYMTNLNGLIPTFTASKMAKVEFDNSGEKIVSGKTAIDFRNAVKLKVTSEDGKSSTVYTVKVEAPLQFSDVKSGAWYYDDVIKAAQLGIVGGRGDGSFGPTDSVKRGDFVLMLVRAAIAKGALNQDDLNFVTGVSPTDTRENPFRDVDLSSYYGRAICWATDNNLVGGYENATFRPEASITRQEAAKIFNQVLKLTEEQNPTNKYADDGSIAKWAYGYVYACQKDGIMLGQENNRFNPGANITRAETATVMVRYYSK